MGYLKGEEYEEKINFHVNGDYYVIWLNGMWR